MKKGRADSSTRRAGARPRLFISYRRRFDHASARLLKDELTRAFGEGAVFRDVDDIRAGEDFPETIREAVEGCDAFLPLISHGWLGLLEELHRPEDFVRREIAAALARGTPVIPVLLGDARMPEAGVLPEEIRDLAFRQAIELSDDRWDYDVGRLVKLVRARAGLSEPTPLFGRLAAALRPFLGTRLGKAAVAAAVLLAAAAGLYYMNIAGRPPTYEGCLNRLRVPGTHEATVEARASGEPVVGADKYQLVRQPPPGGFPLLIRLTDAGRDVGAVSLMFVRGDYPQQSRVAFIVKAVVEPPCAEVEDYFNKDAGTKSEVYDWNSLTVRLGGRNYLLRLGDHGESLRASFAPE